MLFWIEFVFFALQIFLKMRLVHTVSELKQILGEVRNQGLCIGFVPTMGALHNGHLSLVHKAGEMSDYVVVSIFVNPTQFNDKNDLERYPRTLDADLKKLEGSPCKLVFAPEVAEMYPVPDTRKFDFGAVEKVMEGERRPGHFNGVGQVVSKFFDIIRPNKAFFGMKDFQQIAVIKQMVKILNFNDIEIVPCPIVRESDGLAMSSRNTLLDSEHRTNAPVIYQTLSKAVELSKSLSIDELKKWVIKTIDQNPCLETEYFEIVDDEQLQPVSDWNSNCSKVGCIAVHCGKIRLIDNIVF